MAQSAAGRHSGRELSQRHNSGHYAFSLRTRASRTPVETRQCCEPSLESPTPFPTREERGQRRGTAAFLSFSKSRHFLSTNHNSCYGPFIALCAQGPLMAKSSKKS